MVLSPLHKCGGILKEFPCKAMCTRLFNWYGILAMTCVIKTFTNHYWAYSGIHAVLDASYMVRGTLCIAAVLERLWVVFESPPRSNEPHRDVVMSVFDVLMWFSPFSVVVKFVLGPPHTSLPRRLVCIYQACKQYSSGRIFVNDPLPCTYSHNRESH